MLFEKTSREVSAIFPNENKDQKQFFFKLQGLKKTDKIEKGPYHMYLLISVCFHMQVLNPARPVVFIDTGL